MTKQKPKKFGKPKSFSKYSNADPLQKTSLLSKVFGNQKKLDDAIDFATENLDKFIQPISDLRGSSHYRLEAMRGLFRRLQICLRQDKESLSIMEV